MSFHSILSLGSKSLARWCSEVARLFNELEAPVFDWLSLVDLSVLRKSALRSFSA